MNSAHLAKLVHLNVANHLQVNYNCNHFISFRIENKNVVAIFSYLDTLSFYFTPSSGKLLVVSGVPTNSGYKAEVIDIEDPDNTCLDFGSWLEARAACTGGFVQNEVIVCGCQRLIDWGFSKICHLLNTDKSFQMTYERAHSSSIVINNEVSV